MSTSLLGSSQIAA